MTHSEKELFNAVPANEFNTYWVPCTWFIYRLKEAAKRDKLLNPYALETIMREFCEFRAKCGLLWCYDWVSIPMVYTQVQLLRQWQLVLVENALTSNWLNLETLTLKDFKPRSIRG